MFFTSVAYAEDAPAASPAGEPSPIAGFLPLIVMIVAFYFLLIRPQQKKMSEHKKLIAALRRGDKVLTSGGIFGTVTKVEDDMVMVEIAKDVVVKMEKASVAAVTTRPEPADAKPDNKVKAND